jgi:hypothetical protein
MSKRDQLTGTWQGAQVVQGLLECRIRYAIDGARITEHLEKFRLETSVDAR